MKIALTKLIATDKLRLNDASRQNKERRVMYNMSKKKKSNKRKRKVQPTEAVHTIDTNQSYDKVFKGGLDLFN